jgi:hypothetical protein
MDTTNPIKRKLGALSLYQSLIQNPGVPLKTTNTELKNERSSQY